MNTSRHAEIAVSFRNVDHLDAERIASSGHESASFESKEKVAKRTFDSAQS